MKNFIKAMAVLVFFFATMAQATDVINQDNKKYQIKVQGEGNLSISTHTVDAGGSLYGLCNYSFCSFEISGDKVNADKGDRLTIRNGKFVK